jgi:AraC-like DNA-binding protein
MPTATYKNKISQVPAPATSLSGLYHLEPVGVGTAEVESLTSYIARLAEAYGVPPKELVTDAILPNQGKTYKTPKDFFRLKNMWMIASSLNGMSLLCQEWVETLEALTGAQNLRYLTMLTWQNVISRKGLIRKNKAWCPCCYEEWRQRNQIIYEPLLWMLNDMVLCDRHQQALISVCPKCQKTSLALTQRSRPGYCSYCQQWLGNLCEESGNSPIKSDAQEDQRSHWISKVLGTLLATASSLPFPPAREQIANQLRFYITQKLAGNVHASARWVQVDVTQVYLYLQQRRLPSAATLLDLCDTLGVTPLDFLAVCPPQPITPSITKLDQLPRLSGKQGKRLTQEAKEILRTSLNAVVVDDGTPFPSLTQVAAHLGVRTNVLRRYCPDQCEILAIKQENWASDKNQARMRQMLEEALASNEVLSLATLARQFGCQREVLYRYFPDLCEAITTRYRKQFDPVLAEQRLQAALANDEVIVSLREFARQMGYSHGFLLNKCPDLCKKMSERYYEARRKQGEQRRDERRERIRVEAMALHQQGIYPSASRIAKRAGIPGMLLEVEMQEVWHAILIDLGYQK